MNYEKFYERTKLCSGSRWHSEMSTTLQAIALCASNLRMLYVNTISLKRGKNRNKRNNSDFLQFRLRNYPKLWVNPGNVISVTCLMGVTRVVRMAKGSIGKNNVLTSSFLLMGKPRFKFVT